VAYINGAAVYTLADVSPAAQGSGASQAIGAGRFFAAAGSRFANVVMCEVLIYGRALSGVEHTAVSNYLIKKWSL
jgi:hypothetical protein